MCLTEYDEARTMELFKEEGREEGKDEAFAVSIRNLMSNLHLTAEKAMALLNIPSEEYEKYALMLKEIDSTQTYDAQS